MTTTKPEGSPADTYSTFEPKYGCMGSSSIRRRAWGGYIERPGYIYAIGSECGLIKLGCSQEPTNRVSAVACDNPSVGRCWLIATRPVESMRADEALLHWCFTDWHSRGEWFTVKISAATSVFEHWNQVRELALNEMPERFTLKRFVAGRV